MSKKDLSIVVSALNEEGNVNRLLSRLTEVLSSSGIKGEIVFLLVLSSSGIKGEIVFLNNHSTDRTGELAEAFSRKSRIVKVIQRYGRESKDLGSSLREGFENCSGRFIMIMDADLSHDPEEILGLFRHRGEADIVVGSRFVNGGRSDMDFSRVMISRLYNSLVGLVVGARVKDITTGFKLYRKGVIDSLELTNDGFGLHVEILLKAVRKGYRIKEVPIYYRTRSKGESKLFYRKQFKTYARPVFDMLKVRLGF